MSIKIKRNEEGNCINFEGSSNPTYWNACLSGEVDATDANAVNVVNDVITAQSGIKQYEFYRIPFTEFVDKDGNSFATAQDTADYITVNANVIGLGGGGTELNDTQVCFKLDDTSTSIMLDNGYSYGVNTIKALDTGDGLITLNSKLGDITHFTKLDHTNVCDGEGNAISGGLNDVINYLNELFTVGAFESVVISDPYSTMVADVNGEDTSVSYVGYGLDPVGDDIYGSTTTNSQNGLLTTETIDQAGEYFTFDIRNEGTIGFGLVHTQDSYDAGYYTGNSTYANPTTFGVSNSGHSGYQFSHWFHPTPNGSWTNYGANTSASYRSGWYNFNGTQEQTDWLNGDPIKVRVGIDSDGFISIETLRDGVTWEPHARTSYPVPQGSEYRLGIKTNHTGARVFSLPKVHLLEPAAPTMHFRYIESPDDNYHYPLFSTEEEANYYDLQNGGTGTSSTNVYPDEPTFATWYEPANGHIHNGTDVPTSAILFEGNPINWTEITSRINADLAPPSFLDWNLTINELGAVNIAVAPADAGFTTTIVDNDGSGLTLIGLNVEGTAPEVTGDYSSNPSDVYTLNVIRTNSYGSTTATITLTVVNLTAPVTAISGFNHVSGTTAMIDADTMGDGSVVHVNNTVADGERFVIEKAYIETNVLPSLNATNDKYIIGLSNQPETFGTLELADFDAAIVWEYESASSHTFKFYRDGSVVRNIVINSMTQAFYDYAIEVNGTSAWLIACNINSIMNEASPADGGTFSHTYEATSIEDTAPVTIHMATLNTSGDISTDDVETITTPAAPSGNLTSWTKALDFSGSNEHLKQVANYYTVSPLHMNGYATNIAAPSTAGYTANGSSVRPWATAIVFNIDNISQNQHIWNSGEGAGTGDDNIYLRVDASKRLFFGWGREGDGYNECMIHPTAAAPSGYLGHNAWYGVYIANNGTRQSGANATAATLAEMFDIRIMNSAGNNWTIGSNLSVASAWTSTGASMDRSVTGDLTIGGRGSNRSFQGQVASMVVTTLRVNQPMPTDAEIETMITDPVSWLDDYKVGEAFRTNTSSADFTGFAIGTESCYRATQVWLMGEGTYDAYPNGIRNQAGPEDQNTTEVEFNSMQANDIETVNISGLT